MPDSRRTHSCYFPVDSFLRLSESDWLRKMKRHAAFPPTDGMIKSWIDSFRVLHTALSKLPDEYKNLYIVFEYALPKSVQKFEQTSTSYYYADAVLLSKKRVVVLEFKQKKEDYFGDAHQARKYRRRIQCLHDASRGMSKGAILVLTKAQNLRSSYYKVECCSADLLANVIVEQFSRCCTRHPDPSGWCSSTFSIHTKNQPAIDTLS